MGDATCMTCPFWSADPPDRRRGVIRECRRNTPEPYFEGRPDDEDEVARFPVTGAEDWCAGHPLRQRDRLAAMAMQGMAGVALADCLAPRDVARNAYELADAMLAAREKGADHG